MRAIERQYTSALLRTILLALTAFALLALSSVTAQAQEFEYGTQLHVDLYCLQVYGGTNYCGIGNTYIVKHDTYIDLAIGFQEYCAPTYAMCGSFTTFTNAGPLLSEPAQCLATEVAVSFVRNYVGGAIVRIGSDCSTTVLPAPAE